MHRITDLTIILICTAVTIEFAEVPSRKLKFTGLINYPFVAYIDDRFKYDAPQIYSLRIGYIFLAPLNFIYSVLPPLKFRISIAFHNFMYNFLPLIYFVSLIKTKFLKIKSTYFCDEILNV